MDSLKDFPEAIEAVYPKTQIQLCIVHQVRHSLRYVGWKQRKAVAADLLPPWQRRKRPMDAFSERWDGEHPGISSSWRANWERLSLFFNYPPQIRKVIYTTKPLNP